MFQKIPTERLRVFRNSLVLLVPSREGLDLAQTSIKEHLAWEDVLAHFKDQELDPIREQAIKSYIDASKKKIPESVVQAWGIVVTVSEKNEAQAFKITTGIENHFHAIKADSRSRIQDSSVRAEALLPSGPYDFWREGDPSLEVFLPQNAALTELSLNLLDPQVLPDLWKAEEITVKDLSEYFSEGHVAKIKKEGYEESLAIKKTRESVTLVYRSGLY